MLQFEIKLIRPSTPTLTVWCWRCVGCAMVISFMLLSALASFRSSCCGIYVILYVICMKNHRIKEGGKETMHRNDYIWYDK